MKAYLLVFLGGGAGSLARFGLGKWLNALSFFPWGTLSANLLACLVMGMVMGFLAGKTEFGESPRWLLITGFCGGFSTFSTFSAETLVMIQEGRTGMALLYVLASLAICLGSVWAGNWLSHS
jgi:CrcB protein